jgi:O-antigen ligase
MIIAFFALATLFFCLPIIQPVEFSYACAVTMAVLGAVTSTFLALRDQDGLRVARHPLILTLFSLWVLTGISVLSSSLTMISFMGFVKFSLLPLTIYMVMIAPRRLMVLKTIMVGAALLYVGLALSTFVQYLSMPSMLVDGQVVFPFTDANQFALFMAVGIFPFLAASMRHENPIFRYIWAGVAGLCSVALFMIGSLPIILLTILFIILYLIFVPFYSFSQKAQIGAYILMVLSICMSLVLGGGDADGLMRFLSGDMGNTDFYGRLPVWEAAIGMIEDHKFLGIGINSFSHYYQQYRLPIENLASGLTAKNDILQLWAELGILAPILLYATWLIALIQSIRYYGARSLMGVAVACSLGLLFVYAHFDTMIYVPCLMIIMGLLLVSWIQEWGVLQARSFQIKGINIPLFLAALTPLALVLTIVHGMMIAQYFLERSKIEWERQDIASFSEDVDDAMAASFGWHAQAYIYKAMEMEYRMAQTEATAQNRQDIMALYNNALVVNPRFYEALYKRGELYENMGQYMRALQNYGEALSINPQFLPALERLYDLLNLMGRNDEAYAIAKSYLKYEFIHFDSNNFFNAIATQAQERGDQATLKRAQDQLKSVHVRDYYGLSAEDLWSRKVDGLE